MADDVIVYITDSKHFTRKLLQLINTFSKVVGCKINLQKSVNILYTNEKSTEKEIRETAPFIIVTNNNNHFGITLAKQVKDPHDKNFKSLKT